LAPVRRRRPREIWRPCSTTRTTPSPSSREQRWKSRTLSFDADAFSTYAVAYTQAPKYSVTVTGNGGNTNPAGGNNNHGGTANHGGSTNNPGGGSGNGSNTNAGGTASGSGNTGTGGKTTPENNGSSSGTTDASALKAAKDSALQKLADERQKTIDALPKSLTDEQRKKALDEIDGIYSVAVKNIQNADFAAAIGGIADQTSHDFADVTACAGGVKPAQAPAGASAPPNRLSCFPQVWRRQFLARLWHGGAGRMGKRMSAVPTAAGSSRRLRQRWQFSCSC
jgi:hypothetical protein